MNENTSRRIAILRALMIFGIVVLHTPLYVAMQDTGSTAFDFTKALFQSAVFRCSVPILTCISGYLLFSAKPVPYADLIKRKARTLVLPFLVFNAALAPAMLITGYKSDGSWMHALNAAFALNGPPVNYPLAFLRDLFMLMLLTPVFRWMLRHYNNFLWLPVVFFFFHANLDGDLMVRNEMPPLFYLGALAARNRWDMRRFDNLSFSALFMFLAACVWYVMTRTANTEVLRMVSPFLLWPASSLLVNTNAGYWLERMSKYSFFVFLAHAPLLFLAWAAYKTVGIQFGIPYPLFWIACPVVVCAVLIVVHNVASAHMGRVFALFTGGRGTAA